MRCVAEAYRLGAANGCWNLEFVALRGGMAEIAPFVVCRYAVEGGCRVCQIGITKSM